MIFCIIILFFIIKGIKLQIRQQNVRNLITTKNVSKDQKIHILNSEIKEFLDMLKKSQKKLSVELQNEYYLYVTDYNDIEKNFEYTYILRVC